MRRTARWPIPTVGAARRERAERPQSRANAVNAWMENGNPILLGIDVETFRSRSSAGIPTEVDFTDQAVERGSVTIMDEVLTTIASEFADAVDAEQITRIMVRLVMAAALGGLLGLQRERARKAAGVRTHMLVAMGSAMFVLVPELGGMTLEDVSRIVQGVVAGIGFLGAGAILKDRADASVVGLTTAAGIWTTAAIGIACGLGRESTAVISTALTLVIFALIPRPAPAVGE